jgi:hypothetical protein
VRDDKGFPLQAFYNFFSKNMFLPPNPAVIPVQKASSPSGMRRSMKLYESDDVDSRHSPGIGNGRR